MPQKVGAAGQVINFNFVHEFVAENLNKLLYSTFTPGVLKFDYLLSGSEIEINSFSALIRPKNQNFLVKVDTLSSFKVVTGAHNTYLVAYMDWITPPNGFNYETADYGISGYSGYYTEDIIPCRIELDNSINSTPTKHNLTVGDIIRFDASKGGIIQDQDYYVVELPNNSEESFIISASAGGTPFVTYSKEVQYLNFKKMNSHIVKFSFVEESEIDSDYNIILGKFIVSPGGIKHALDLTYQTQVYLNDNCINYDTLIRSGVRTLEGTNPDYIDDGTTQRHVGNTSGNIPLSNSTMNVGLNAQYLNGITVSDAANSIGLKNGVLSTNMIAARLLRGGYEYALGQSGLISYTGFSGYNVSGWSGASGFSAYSGYLPINNTVLQISLNAEYFDGYRVSEFSLVDHTHRLDEIADGTTYKKITNVDENGRVVADSLGPKTLEYRHQSLTVPFRYDLTTPKKIFMLAGEIGKRGSSGITFRKTFTDAPRVFLLNQETDEWKSVDETAITTTGFWVHHHEGTSGTSLVSDSSTAFSTHWLAVGELA
jgi:hypothetical protein